MNRRKFLAVCGTASVCGVSSCNALLDGDKSDGSRPTRVEGPAQFTDFTIETQPEVSVDTPFSVTVSAFNYGTETGHFSGSITATEGVGSVSKAIDLSGVKGEQHGETTVELSVSLADGYVLTVSDSPPARTTTSGYYEETTTRIGEVDARAETRIEVGPKTAAIGESLDLTYPLRVTLTDIQY